METINSFENWIISLSCLLHSCWWCVMFATQSLSKSGPPFKSKCTWSEGYGWNWGDSSCWAHFDHSHSDSIALGLINCLHSIGASYARDNVHMPTLSTTIRKNICEAGQPLWFSRWKNRSKSRQTLTTWLSIEHTDIHLCEYVRNLKLLILVYAMSWINICNYATFWLASSIFVVFGYRHLWLSGIIYIEAW